MYEGKCAKKGWSWKKVQDARLLSFQEEDSNGTIHCVLETNSERGFTAEELLAIQAAYKNVQVSKLRVVFSSIGVYDKSANIQAYESLMAFLRASIRSADKAIVGVKKLPTQIHIVRCGETSNG